MKVVTKMIEKEVIKMLASEHIHSMSDADIAVKEQIINNLDIVENAEIHDENFCPYDLWAPHINKIENVAFSCYAKHTQETEDIIKTIIAAYHNGETNFSLELDDDFSQGDLEYIEREVKRRIEAGY